MADRGVKLTLPSVKRIARSLEAVDGMPPKRLQSAGMGPPRQRPTQPGDIPVDCTADGGSTYGGPTTAANIIYTIKRRGETSVLASGVVVVMQRPIGKTLAAQHGYAYYDAAEEVYKLWWCDEIPDKGQRSC